MPSCIPFHLLDFKGLHDTYYGLLQVHIVVQTIATCSGMKHHKAQSTVSLPVSVYVQVKCFFGKQMLCGWISSISSLELTQTSSSVHTLYCWACTAPNKCRSYSASLKQCWARRAYVPISMRTYADISLLMNSNGSTDCDIPNMLFSVHNHRQ